MVEIKDDLQLLLNKQRAFFYSQMTKSMEFRRKQLEKLKHILEKYQPKLVESLYKDLRRSPEVTVGVEINHVLRRINHTIDHFAEWAKPIKLPDNPVGTSMIVKQPRGSVLVIGAFNFPVDLCFHPAISAIAAGCTVVIKPSELSAHTSQVLYEMITNNFDPAYFACVEGDAEISCALTSLHWDHIFYTGSPRIGKLVMASAAKNLVPVTLELGGKNPCIALPDANMHHVAKSLMAGKFLNCGQVCLMTDYVILFDDKSKHDFKSAISKCLSDTFGQHPQTNPNFGRIVNQQTFDRLDKLLKQTKGELIYKAKDENDRSDLFIGPHVFACEPNDILMQEEIFGPILVVICLQDLNDAIEYINKLETPLSLYIFTNNQEKLQQVLNETMSGGVTVNGILLQAKLFDLPFGGIGHSGMGRSGGKYGFDQFTHERPVLIAAQPRVQ